MAKKSRPMMFQDEPAEIRLREALKISDLKNLGPMTEKHFLKAGIKTVPQFTKLGWKKTMEKLTKVDYKNSHTLFAYALIGALTNTDWNHITTQQKQEARDFCAELRASYKKKYRK